MKRISKHWLWMLGLSWLAPQTISALPPSQHEHHHPKISRDALDARDSDLVPVIIQYKTAPGHDKDNRIFAAAGNLKGDLALVRSKVASVPRYKLEELADDPDVAYISKDRKLGARGPAAPAPPAAPGTPVTTLTSAEYTAEPINAPAVWAKGYLGSGIGVAVIDSGVTNVDDLSVASGPQLTSLLGPVLGALNTIAPTPGAQGRIVYSQNFVPGENTTSDQFGHGTHVAGLIAGNGKKSTGNNFYRTFYGSAPNANIVNLRALDENGAGTDSSVIAAIQTAISLKSKYNIRVINLSLGRPIWESYTQDPLCQAVEQAWKAGIVVVVAAGNDGRDLNLNTEGYGTIEAPGNDPYVITVGATRTMSTASVSDDLMASYSSKGPSFIDQIAKPDIVAPGNLVVSLKFGNDSLAQQNPSFVTLNSFYQTKGNNNASNDYFPLSGTSMATGVASGAVADLLQAKPSLTPDQVKALLMRSANKNVFPATSTVTDGGVNYIAHDDVFTTGAGYLDLAAALTAASTVVVPSGTAMSPTASYDPNSGNTSLVIDNTALWGASAQNNGTALWGASNVYGAGAFGGNGTALWGASAGGNGTALWGASAGNGTALWGANDPQAFTALWGASAGGNGTALWGAGTPDAASALWGADDLNGATALWGASSSNGTALWGASGFLGNNTALWGANAPLEF